jgi:translocation and assembly module TamB
MHRHLLAILLLLSALAAAGGFALYSERLPGWGFALLQENLPGELSAEMVTGRLAGPLTIHGLRYSSGPMSLSLEELRFDWRPTALLYNTLRISTLQLRGLAIELPATDDEDKSSAASPLTLPPVWLPFALELDELRLEQVALIRPEGEPLNIDLVTLAASLRWHTLELRPLHIQSRELGLEGEVIGSVGLRDQLPIDLQLQWRWQHAGAGSGPESEVIPLAATGTLRGDLTALQLQQHLSSPVAARLDATLSSLLTAPQWQARLSLPALESVQLTPLMPSVAYPFALRDALIEAEGDLNSMRFEGGAVATLEASGEVALQLGGSVDATALELSRLRLTLPGAPGELGGHGRLAFADLSYLWHGAWREVGWPLRGERQLLSERGAITVTGVGSDYRLSLDTTLQPSGLPPSHWRLAANGDTQGINLQGIHAALFDGTLEGEARLAWSPEVAWQGHFAASGLNPAAAGPAWSAWPGAVALGGDYRGTLSGGAPASLTLEGQLTSLGGTLRERPLGGGGSARWHNGELTLNALQLKWGSASATLAGRAGKLLDLKGELAAGDLAELLPQGSGSLQGTVGVSGASTAPQLRLALNGKGLGWQAYRTERATLKSALDLTDATPSSLELRLEGVQQGEQSLGLLTLRGSGKIAKHRLTLSLDDALHQRGAEVVLGGGYSGGASGSYGDGRWQGQLERLVLRPYEASKWQLVAPAPLELSLQQASLAALCLREQEARLCLEGGWQATSGLQATLTLQALPLAQLTPMLPPRLKTTGEINGTARLQLQPGERLTLNGDFALHEGRITLFEADGRTEQRVLPLQVATLHLATLDRVAADGATEEVDLNAVARLSLSAHDHLDASLQLPLQQGWLRPVAEQPLRGRLEIKLQDLTLIELLQPEISDPRGALQFELQLDGTLAAPLPTGELRLIGGSCAVPRLGLRLEGLELKADMSDGERLELLAAARSGGGTLSATGALQLTEEQPWALRLQLDGDNFEVARIPEARLKLSPHLTVEVEPQLVRINGSLVIPEARLEPRDISQAVTVSRDVVIVDEEAAREERWRIYTHLEVEAADSIRLIGYGFDGRIGGRLLLIDEPQRLTRGRGELRVVEGSSYTALGQKLQTPRGRLIFADSPVDNPGLDIVAQREVGDVVAGVRVNGTARDPVLTLFSRPSMDEADILAYITLGRPLSSAGQSDGQTMMRAANTAGLAGGDYIAGYVGRQFGLEEARLESEGESEQPWLVIGKHLSPRLYIRYGTALLESGNSVLVRYRLGERWFLEGESGNDSGGDLIYTFERP